MYPSPGLEARLEMLFWKCCFNVIWKCCFNVIELARDGVYRSELIYYADIDVDDPRSYKTICLKCNLCS